jgi:hypothetical protein
MVTNLKSEYYCVWNIRGCISQIVINRFRGISYFPLQGETWRQTFPPQFDFTVYLHAWCHIWEDGNIHDSSNVMNFPTRSANLGPQPFQAIINAGDYRKPSLGGSLSDCVNGNRADWHHGREYPRLASAGWMRPRTSASANKTNYASELNRLSDRNLWAKFSGNFCR